MAGGEGALAKGQHMMQQHGGNPSNTKASKFDALMKKGVNSGAAGGGVKLPSVF